MLYAAFREKVPVAEDVKNFYEKDYDEIITDIPRVYEALTGGTNLPMKKPVRIYEDEYSLLKLYSLKTKINELLGKNVWLKSGAYLVIEPTEALTVIDVNTGKFIKRHPIPTKPFSGQCRSGERVRKAASSAQYFRYGHD